MLYDFMLGMVWLVGVGFGDFDFLICKVECLIVVVDIVFYDVLVGVGVFDLILIGVECVSVGKCFGCYLKD